MGQGLAETGATFLDRRGHERCELRGVAQGIWPVMGVWEDGRHDILHSRAAPAEDLQAWTGLLAALERRGLDPDVVRMVVSDGKSGLPAALAQEVLTL